MIDLRHVKAFVRTTLGCGCRPEGVFRSIDCRAGFVLDGIGEIAAAITVGNLLLIYVVRADRGKCGSAFRSWCRRAGGSATRGP